MRAERPIRIGVMAYEGCFGAEIFGITDLLRIANHVARRSDVAAGDVFEVSVVARRGALVRVAGGISVGARQWHPGLDTLVVPGFELASAEGLTGSLARWRQETSFLSLVAARGVPVASVCVGAFLLGEAGLLDGRTVTTSWLFARELAARHPRATVDADAMMVADGNVTTTAAFSTVHDLAMHLVTRYAGDQVARSTSRIGLVPDNRDSQAAYVDREVIASTGPRFARSVQRWLVDRLEQPYDLPAMSRAFEVSPRTMLRRFALETGRTPLEFLREARVNAATRLLESTDWRVPEIMERIGYVDPSSFRRLFARQTGMTPGAYRRQFTRTAR
ncbi:GlxA family transcriptional regulator [Kibdelosporangium phytohabitans]|nr:helix-turn-helix domain-containing protein [Kibdelosporangium phytohabitans]MBE1463719.1 transcriptional regulator GlxA family with amidase domain [Kibdelosporangium phytohabitans]